MASAADARTEIEKANVLLEAAGIKQTVDPLTLVSASKELGKSLRETLEYVARLFDQAQGAA